MDLATLFVRFKADTSDVDKGIKGIESTATKSGANIAKTLASAFGAAAIGAGIKKSIDAASDLNETVSKTRTIFGEASTAVEATAATAAKSMGLSKTAYLDAASGLKGLLDNLGLTRDESTKWSQDLTKLGSDLGSFFNKDPAQAIEAIQAALRGESEPIRAFNVQLSDAAVKAEAMKEGLYAGTGAIDAHAKAQATLALIMQQTTTAQGDFAKTADGVANGQRIAKAETENAAASLGQNLLPIYGKLVDIVGKVAEVFGSLPGPVQTAIVALAGIVALSGPIGSMIDLIGGIREAMAGLATSAGGLALVAVGIVAAIALFSSGDDAQKQIVARSKEVATSLGKETNEIAKQQQAAAGATTAVQGYADAQLALSRALTGADEKGQRLAKALGALGFQADDAARILGLLKTTAGNEAVEFDKTTGSFKRYGTAATDAAADQADLLLKMLEAKGVSRDVAIALVGAGQSASAFGGRVDAVTENTKGFSDANKVLVDAIIEVGKQSGDVDLNLSAQGALNAEVATNAYNASLVAQAEAQAGVSRNSDQAQKVLGEYQTIIDNLTPEQEKLRTATEGTTAALDKVAPATQGAANAMDEYAVRQDQAKASAEANKDATDALKKSLDKSTGSTNAAKRAADDYGKALDTVFGASIDLEEANRDLAAGWDTVKQAIKDNGNTLDIHTEKGRANRTAIEDQVKTIQAKIKADIASGVSVADATAAGELYRQKLIDTSGTTKKAKAAAEEYINQLGLTPENIQTAVGLANDEETKRRLKGLLDQLGDIDAGAAAEIQADIDQGKFDEAEAALNKLARNRPVVFVPSGNFTSGNVAGPRSGSNGAPGRSALGRYVPAGANFLTTVSEPGSSDEVILPLGNPSRIRELARGNNVGSRILDALADDDLEPHGAVSTSSSSSSSTSLTVVNNRQDLTLDDANRLLMLARLS